jgi:hypothetical protein
MTVATTKYDNNQQQERKQQKIKTVKNKKEKILGLPVI